MKFGGAMDIYVLIAASGISRRMGEDKLLLPLEVGTVIEETMEIFSHEKIKGVVLVCRDPVVEQMGRRHPNITSVVKGGEQRAESVMAGLRAIPEGSYVLVHDGARPFLSDAALERAIEAAEKKLCFFLGIPLRDTLKEMEGHVVKRTPPREHFVLAQTPQGAPRDLLLAAYEEAKRAGFVGTDDCSYLEFYGVEVVLVPGEEGNWKLTFPEDRRLL
jgi:2-C-methyl-D-erythritol 4-phosphate cytidylyltransferase